VKEVGLKVIASVSQTICSGRIWTGLARGFSIVISLLMLSRIVVARSNVSITSGAVILRF